jgi:hypothetical protein
MLMHNFSLGGEVLLYFILFYFMSRSSSKFKFVLNSNVFGNYKGVGI